MDVLNTERILYCHLLNLAPYLDGHVCLDPGLPALSSPTVTSPRGARAPHLSPQLETLQPF